MADWHKIADKYFSNDRLETGASKLTQTNVIGTAISDSENGYVKVMMDGAVTYPDDSPADGVYIPTGPSVKKGDQVHISLNGGVGKSPVITNATGWGDRLASETVEIANDALEVASAVDQHFWSDTNGAHVTDVTQDEWHEAEEDDFSDISDQKPYHNALWNSLGMLFRSGLKNLVSITRSAISFFNGEGNTSDDIVAQFGKEGFQIGINDESHLVGDYHSLNLIDKEDNTYFEVADLRDHNGEAIITEGLGAFAQRPYLYPSYKIDELISIEGEGRATYTVDPSGEIIYMDPMPQQYEAVTVCYKTSDVRVKTYTLGVRDSDPAKPSGGLSVVEGYMNSAIGKESHAEGAHNDAWGGASHVEGNHTVAYSDCDHAEGYHTQAGTSRVYNWVTANHAEGSYTQALGEHSHAQNFGTIAHTNQTAIGRYNIADDHDIYAFIIGNGTSDQNRSNCLAVKWNGDIVNGDGNTFIGSSKVLYNDSTGSNSTIQLSESAANFDYMRIYFKKNSDSNAYGSVDIYKPNGKVVSLVLTNPYSSSDAQLVGRTVSISGTSITNYRRELYGNTGAGGTLVTTTDLSLYITRVEAWNGGANISSAGSGGSGNDAYYIHEQGTDAFVWNIAHYLGKNPSVTIIDSGGNNIEGALVYIDDNNLQVTFSVEVRGTAYCN